MRSATRPRPAAASSVASPCSGPKRPRSVEVPKCSTSKCTKLWSGSNRYSVAPAAAIVVPSSTKASAA